MAEQIITRADARAQGLKRYLTGEPCLHDHVCERFVSDQSCAECQRLRSLAWKELNRERSREITREWKSANPGAGLEWHQQNREKSRAACRQYYERNREAMQERARRWGRENPEKVAANTSKRRARIVEAAGKHTAADLQALLKAQSHRCIYCQANLRKGRHLDHIMPLVLGGSNGPDNLQFTCAPCNLSKGARDPIAFAQERGLLL